MDRIYFPLPAITARRTMNHLELHGLSLAFGRHTIVHDVSFSLARGAIGCLLGPSGCGKTSVLRCIAGFETPAAGHIVLGGETVASATASVPPERRNIGMVFQDYALFPHLTVAENVAFGLRRLPRSERSPRVERLLRTVGLAHATARYPHELSGGQQQRVALARALAPQPQLLLLDEPFSNLDVDLRERLSLEVRDIIKETGTTAILVTHDQHEAFAMADEIGLLHEGRIQQWDTPYMLYHKPVNRFVANFIGKGVLLSGQALNEHEVQLELGVLESDIPLSCDASCFCDAERCRVDVLLRPDDIVHDDASAQTARVVHKAFRGASILYTLALDSGAQVLSLVPSHHNHALGERIGIRLGADHVVTFHEELPPAPQPA